MVTGFLGLCLIIMLIRSIASDDLCIDPIACGATLVGFLEPSNGNAATAALPGISSGDKIIVVKNHRDSPLPLTGWELWILRSTSDKHIDLGSTSIIPANGFLIVYRLSGSDPFLDAISSFSARDDVIVLASDDIRFMTGDDKIQLRGGATVVDSVGQTCDWGENMVSVRKSYTGQSTPCDSNTHNGGGADWQAVTIHSPLDDWSMVSWSNLLQLLVSEESTTTETPTTTEAATTNAPTTTLQACPALSTAEMNFRMWGTHTCQEVQNNWKVCTKEDDANHAMVMANCPATCAMARNECLGPIQAPTTSTGAPTITSNSQAVANTYMPVQETDCNADSVSEMYVKLDPAAEPWDPPNHFGDPGQFNPNADYVSMTHFHMNFFSGACGTVTWMEIGSRHSLSFASCQCEGQWGMVLYQAPTTTSTSMGAPTTTSISEAITYVPVQNSSACNLDSIASYYVKLGPDAEPPWNPPISFANPDQCNPSAVFVSMPYYWTLYDHEEVCGKPFAGINWMPKYQRWNLPFDSCQCGGQWGEIMYQALTTTTEAPTTTAEAVADTYMPVQETDCNADSVSEMYVKLDPAAEPWDPPNNFGNPGQFNPNAVYVSMAHFHMNFYSGACDTVTWMEIGSRHSLSFASCQCGGQWGMVLYQAPTTTTTSTGAPTTTSNSEAGGITLFGDHAAGESTLRLSDVSEYSAGMSLIVSGAGNSETKTIVAVNPDRRLVSRRLVATGTVDVDSPLQNSYPHGSSVVIASQAMTCYSLAVIGKYCRSRQDLGKEDGLGQDECHNRCDSMPNCHGLDYYPSKNGGQCVPFSNTVCAPLVSSGWSDVIHRMKTPCQADGPSPQPEPEPMADTTGAWTTSRQAQIATTRGEPATSPGASTGAPSTTIESSSTTEAWTTSTQAVYVGGYILIGDGWCRPSGCDIASTSCRSNGYYKENSNSTECLSHCDTEPTCIGYAIKLPSPARCFVYTSISNAPPSGWFSYVNSYHYIGASSGKAGVQCFKKAPTTTTTIEELSTTTEEPTTVIATTSSAEAAGVSTDAPSTTLEAMATSEMSTSSTQAMSCYSLAVTGKYCRNRQSLGDEGGLGEDECRSRCDSIPSCSGIDYYPSKNGGQCVPFSNTVCTPLVTSDWDDATHRMKTSCEATTELSSTTSATQATSAPTTNRGEAEASTTSTTAALLDETSAITTEGETTITPEPSTAAPSTTTATKRISGQMTLQIGGGATETQVGTAAKAALADHFEIDASAITVSVQQLRRLEESQQLRRLSNSWLVEFSIVVPGEKLQEVEEKVANARPESELELKMKEQLTLVGVPDSATVSISNFKAELGSVAQNNIISTTDATSALDAAANDGNAESQGSNALIIPLILGCSSLILVTFFCLCLFSRRCRRAMKAFCGLAGRRSLLAELGAQVSGIQNMATMSLDKIRSSRSSRNVPDLPPNKKYHFFLSHKKSHSIHRNRSESVALLLHDNLEDRGWHGFFDVDKLKSISQEDLCNHVAESCCMIVVLSDETCNSEWCRMEWEVAAHENIPVACVVDISKFSKDVILDQVSKTNPYLLKFQWIDYADKYRKMVAGECATWLSEAMHQYDPDADKSLKTPAHICAVKSVVSDFSTQKSVDSTNASFTIVGSSSNPLMKSNSNSNLTSPETSNHQMKSNSESVNDARLAVIEESLHLQAMRAPSPRKPMLLNLDHPPEEQMKIEAQASALPKRRMLINLDDLAEEETSENRVYEGLSDARGIDSWV